MQIQISWLLQKPTDLDLHCLQRQGISGFSRTRVNILINSDSVQVFLHGKGLTFYNVLGTESLLLGQHVHFFGSKRLWGRMSVHWAEASRNLFLHLFIKV